MHSNLHTMPAVILALSVATTFPTVALSHGDSPESEDAHRMIEEMREVHMGHEHEHDFEGMEEMSHEDMERVMATLVDLGLAVPPMDAAHGKDLFVNKGCIVCHQVNGVGGEMGPSLNASQMPSTMNAFEFAARMWRGAGAMIALQEDLFGEQIDLDGQDLADLVAFVHDETVQASLKAEDIPDNMKELIP